MRDVNRAICTSAEPVSLSFVRYVPMTSVLTSLGRGMFYQKPLASPHSDCRSAQRSSGLSEQRPPSWDAFPDIVPRTRLDPGWKTRIADLDGDSYSSLASKTLSTISANCSPSATGLASPLDLGSSNSNLSVQSGPRIPRNASAILACPAGLPDSRLYCEA